MDPRRRPRWSPRTRTTKAGNEDHYMLRAGIPNGHVESRVLASGADLRARVIVICL